jgi:ribosomal protein L7/L12
MDIEQLAQQTKKILDLSEYMDKVFGFDASHLRIAIMAGIGDSYNAGMRDAFSYERENNAISRKIEAEQQITPLLKENVLTMSRVSKLEAVKHLKNNTGMFLKDCKEFVEKWIDENNNNENLQS